MENFEIELNAREGSGSSASRRYRKQGLVPSIVYYAHGERSIPALISNREFTRLGRLAKTSQVFTLKSTTIPDLNGKAAIVKQVQLDYLKSEVVHVDFQALREDEEVSVQVALKFVGEAQGVKLDGGILTIVSHDVRVRCLPRVIPSEIEVDVTPLGMGDSVKVKNLTVPAGVRLEGNPEETLASVVAVHVQVEEAPVAAAEGAAVEGAPAAEGQAAAAEGAAPAAGGAEKKTEGADKEKGKAK